MKMRVRTALQSTVTPTPLSQPKLKQLAKLLDEFEKFTKHNNEVLGAQVIERVAAWVRYEIDSI